MDKKKRYSCSMLQVEFDISKISLVNPYSTFKPYQSSKLMIDYFLRPYLSIIQMNVQALLGTMRVGAALSVQAKWVGQVTCRPEVLSLRSIRTNQSCADPQPPTTIPDITPRDTPESSRWQKARTRRKRIKGKPPWKSPSIYSANFLDSKKAHRNGCENLENP
jgi:hypothetical protein